MHLYLYIIFSVFLISTSSCEDAVEIDRSYDDDLFPDVDADVVENVSTEFVTQWGDENDNYATSVVVIENGNIFVAGYTNISHQTDIALTKLDNRGDILWTKSEGTDGMEKVYDIETDTYGNIYVTGMTTGEFEGNISKGNEDLLLLKFDHSGELEWALQIGTEHEDSGRSIAVDDSGNIYACGYTDGIFDGESGSGTKDTVLIKAKNSGELLWIKQIAATAFSLCTSMEITSSQYLYLGGTTEGVFGENENSGHADLFVLKLDLNGNTIWSVVHGTEQHEYGGDIAVDSSDNVYITGQTNGAFKENKNMGGGDVFLGKFDKDGAHIWTKQFGTEAFDEGSSITVDTMDNIYVSGVTYGAFEESVHYGVDDIFASKFDSNGENKWTKQFGTGASDWGKYITSDSFGNVYITGYTGGVLDFNPYQNESLDSFLMAIPAEG